MKKATPYIVLGLLLLILVIGLMFSTATDKFDQRITLNRKDKIPYGTYVAYNNLQYLFPDANIRINKKEPGYWEDSVVQHDTAGQAMIIMAKEFNASNGELTQLFHFVSKGNDVFISAYDLGLDARNFFHVNLNYGDAGYPIFEDYPELDSLKLTLSQPPYPAKTNYFEYPGRKFYSYFNTFDSSMSYVLGRTSDSEIVFLRMRAGNGSFFIHTAPLAFSNYFLLHKNNVAYYNQVLSALQPKASGIIWDEYFAHKPMYDRPKEASPLRILMEQPAFKMGLLTALAGLLLFVLLGLKRRQRMIPEIKMPVNDSMDFVKTIGRLYFQKKDNRNLGLKMSNYFTEYVHSHFHIPTEKMDDNFVTRLSQKSGCDVQTIRSITEHIQFINETSALHDQQITEFYTLLEKFYKTT